MCILLAELTALQRSAKAGDRAALRVLNRVVSRDARASCPVPVGVPSAHRTPAWTV